MTKPGYPQGCPAGSQGLGITLPSGNAWNVNLHNGNANWNNQDNHYHVRAVRASQQLGLME